MADDETMKLPGSGYEFITRVIQAYAAVGGAAALEKVAGVLSVDPSQVSRNTGFLVSVGVLDGGKYKKITAAGSQLALAMNHDNQEEVSRLWREVLEPNAFIQRVLASVRIRGGMDVSTLTSQIAYMAGAAKSKNTTTGSGAVLEMLVRSGLVRERDGKYVVPPAPTAPTRSTNDEASAGSQVSGDEARPPTVPVSPVAHQSVVTLPVGDIGAGGVSVSIRVNVTASVSELADLATGLRRLLEELGTDPSALNESENLEE